MLRDSVLGIKLEKKRLKNLMRLKIVSLKRMNGNFNKSLLMKLNEKLKRQMIQSVIVHMKNRSLKKIILR